MKKARMLDVRIEPKPGFFILFLALSLLAVFGFFQVGSRVIEKADQEANEESERALAELVEDLADRFDPGRWIAETLPRLLPPRGDVLNPETARLVERRATRIVPGLRLLVFDAAGKVVHPQQQPGRRSREDIWTCLLAQTRGEQTTPELAAKLAKAEDFVTNWLGPLAKIEDLVQADGLARPFLNQDQPWFSLVIPQEALARGRRHGNGGYWFQLPAAGLPRMRIARAALQTRFAEADLALVLRRENGRPVCEYRLGKGAIGRSVAKRFLRGNTKLQTTRGWLWMSRYIPDRSGRYLVAGIGPGKRRSGYHSWKALATALTVIGLFLANLLGYRWFWQGHPFPFPLRAQISILFLVIAIIPLLSMAAIGLERFADQRRLGKREWERRMEAALGQVLFSYREFQNRQIPWMEQVEGRIDRAMRDGMGRSDLEALLGRLVANRSRIDVILDDARGFSVKKAMEMPSMNRHEEHRNLMKRFLGQLLEAEKRPVPSYYASATLLVSGYELLLIMNNVLRNLGQINPIAVGTRSFLQRKAIIRGKNKGDPITGAISWVFEESEFARPYIQETLARFQGTKAIAGEDLPDPFALARVLRQGKEPDAERLLRLFQPHARAVIDRVEREPFEESLLGSLLADELSRIMVEIDLGKLFPSLGSGPAQEARDGILVRNRRILERILGAALVPAVPQPRPFGAIDVLVAGRDGILRPAGVRRTNQLNRLLSRGWSSQYHESAFLPGAEGTQFAIALASKKLGGHQLVALVDARQLELAAGMTARIVGFAFLLGGLFLLLAAHRLSTDLIRRVDDLRRFVDGIVEGRYEMRAEAGSQDELGQLAITFNDMAAGLERLERLRHFVSEKVWEKTRLDDSISLALGGERQEAAVLFSHVYHFDDLLERESPEDVIGMLNGYLTLMEDAVKGHHGWIDKFIGDAVMAVFDPVPEGRGAKAGDPAERAVCAALAMLEATARFNAERRRQGRFEIRTDVGVHVGQVVSGNVGSRDSAGQLTHTVIGDTVNTAARIQGYAMKQGDPSVLVSEAVRERLGEGFRIEHLEGVSLKGKTVVLNLFRVCRCT